MANGYATSIFGYLTAKNPDLICLDLKNATLSWNPIWIQPTHVRSWDEFSSQTMESVFGGKLMEECRRERMLPFPVPHLDPIIDCVENGENSARDVLTRWTRAMVNAALREVDDIFDPVFWVSSSRKDADQVVDTFLDDDSMTSAAVTRRGRPPRRAAQRRPQSEKRKRRPPQPDGACVSFGSSARAHGSSNRLPGEIKPGSKWTSERLVAGDLTEADGKLRLQRDLRRDAAPIVQIYHYCVLANARYGFLITSKEVMVVRIGPVVSGPDESAAVSRRNTSQLPPPSNSGAAGTKGNTTSLQHELKYNGLLEYKAIPWANHCSRLASEKDGNWDMTINLSLWILCILAGNDCDPDWGYKPLKDELLRPEEASEEEIAERQGGDELETATEPSQSAPSSFTFSNPALSFSASQLSQLSEKIPLSSYIVDNRQGNSALTVSGPAVERGSGTDVLETSTGMEQTRKRRRHGGEVAESAAGSMGEEARPAEESGEGRRRRRRTKLI